MRTKRVMLKHCLSNSIDRENEVEIYRVNNLPTEIPSEEPTEPENERSAPSDQNYQLTEEDAYPLTVKQWMQCVFSRILILDSLVEWESLRDEMGAEKMSSMKPSRLQIIFATRVWKAYIDPRGQRA